MMLTHDTAPTPPDTIEAKSPRPIAKRRKPVRKILTAAAAIVVAGTVAGVAIVETSDPASSDRPPQPTAQSRHDLVRDLVERGVVPAATLESAPPSRDDLVRELVARGVVPAATLESAPPSREDLVRDLVARGLVPAATLE